MPRLASGRRGVAAVELAMALPVLFLLLVGFLDVVYVGRGFLRVQNTAAQIGQMLSQCTKVGAADQTALLAFAATALGPYAAAGKGWAVVVTAIQVDASGNASAKWSFAQRTNGSANPAAFANVAPANSLPANLALASDEMIYRTEVFADIETMLYSKAISLLAERMGPRPAATRAYSALLHVSRSPSAANLTSLSATESCL